MKPRFRHGEVVIIVRAPGVLAAPGDEAVVEEVAGPNDDGTGWLLTLRLYGDSGADAMIVLGEEDLEPTGLGETDNGERVALGGNPEPPEPTDCLELRLFTEITDGIEAARVAESIEQEIAALLGGGVVTTEAERHWSAPYNYELGVTVIPESDPVEALQILAEAGGDGWLGCRDDGWRCDLWWSSNRDPDAMLIVPEVHAAHVSFIPWSSPARRPDEDRPLVAVNVTDDDEPTEPQADDEPPEE